MKIMKSKVNFELDKGKIKIKKNKNYIVPDYVKHAFQKDITLRKYLSFKDLTYPILDYEKDDPKKVKHIIIIRSGGIGDLIAISSLVQFLKETKFKNSKFYFISQKKYQDLFDVAMPDWLKFKHLFSEMSILDSIHLKNSIRVVYFEGVIEKSKQNWFELMFKVINAPFEDRYGRPHIDINKLNKFFNNTYPEHFNEDKLNVILNKKATSIVRSMNLENIFEVAKNIYNKEINENKITFHVHEISLTEEDYTYMKTLSEDEKNLINIIPKSSLRDYFNDLYHADNVISIDSAAVHFREGIEKPAIGLYSSFPTEARTKYYKFVKSIDINSPCPYQPCFIHTKKATEVCPIEKDLLDKGIYMKTDFWCAPCLNKKFNEDLIKEIKNKLEI